MLRLIKRKKDAKKETDAANKSDNAKVAEDELRTQSSKLKAPGPG